LAFDESDPFYNNVENQARMTNHFNKLAGQYAKLVFLKCVDSNGWVTFLWNVAFQHAMDDGVDYFYQLNDDIKLENSEWSEIFVKALKTNPFKQNFGVTGPIDRFNPRLLTQCFVSRNHYSIFGTLYPYSFKNWYADNWISEVYSDWKSNVRSTHDEMFVVNSQTFGTRYSPCENIGIVDLRIELERGKQLVKNWLEEYK
jgi:hypothetical protein